MRLIVQSGNQVGQIFELDRDTITLGATSAARYWSLTSRHRAATAKFAATKMVGLFKTSAVQMARSLTANGLAERVRCTRGTRLPLAKRLCWSKRARPFPHLRRRKPPLRNHPCRLWRSAGQIRRCGWCWASSRSFCSDRNCYRHNNTRSVVADPAAAAILRSRRPFHAPHRPRCQRSRLFQRKSSPKLRRSLPPASVSNVRGRRHQHPLRRRRLHQQRRRHQRRRRHASFQTCFIIRPPDKAKFGQSDTITCNGRRRMTCVPSTSTMSRYLPTVTFKMTWFA